MSPNITRSEAAERAALLTVHGYDVDLDLTTGPETFGMRTVVTFDCAEPGASTWIDLIAPRLHRAVLNGREIDGFDGFRLPLGDLQASNELIVEADCAYMNTGEGLHRFVDPEDDAVYLYTQFETADARRMYACFEQPDLKATFTLGVTASSGWQVVSNAATPAPRPLGEGVSHWQFPTSARMSPYITALVAGPYHVVRDEYVGEHGTYPLGIYCRRALAQHLDPEDIFEVTKQGFAFFEGAFGVPYAFGKYDQLFVPEFNAGAMENAGCVTFREEYVFRSRVTDIAYEVRANTILHEMAHMWFGDLVTMSWWDDLWLNESFAEWAAHYSSVQATRYTEAWTTFNNQRKTWAYRQDQLPSTHPIAADMVDLDAVRVNFDGITYAKGASALRQLVAWVGEPEFLRGIHEYFTKHAWGNTRLQDLFDELEAASGRSLSGWAAEWLQTSGVNLMRPVIALADDGTYAAVSITQEPPMVPEGIAPTLRSHRMAIGLYDRTAEGLARRERIELDVTGTSTPVPQLTGMKAADLLLLNDDDLTFTKIRLDEKSWRTAVSGIADIPSSLSRALVWGAAWDMVRDAEASTGDYLDLVLSGLPRESDIGVVQTVLRQLKLATDIYSARANRTGYWVRLGDALWSWAQDADPASDRQLAFVRALASVAWTDEHLDALQGLLDGTVTLDGLAVDAELRWTLLQRLAVAGRAYEEAISAEEARDHTASGVRQAALAMAARRTASAKQAAWDDLMGGDLANSLIEATMAGFMQAGQEILLESFRDRYFAELPGIWERRTSEMAQELTIGLYPTILADQATVDATDAFLASTDLKPAAVRLVSECRDGVVRALRCQSRDAQ